MDLRQDSDEENERLCKRKRNQPEALKYDSVYVYFDDPFHGVNQHGERDVGISIFLSHLPSCFLNQTIETDIRIMYSHQKDHRCPMLVNCVGR